MTEKQEAIKAYILEHCVDEGVEADIREDTPLISGGLVDSMGLISLICFLEMEYKIRIGEDEATVKAFDNLKKIERFVNRRIEDANEE